MSVVKSPKHVKTCWIAPSHITEKPWGEERTWHALGSVKGKILYIKEGHRNSLKVNRLKEECLFVLKGKIEVEYGSELSFEDPIMHPFKTEELSYGEILNVQSMCPYRIRALTDAQVVEIGHGPVADFIRIEDDYGRK